MLDGLAVGADEVDSSDAEAGLSGHFEGRFREDFSQRHIKAAEQIDSASPEVGGGEDGVAHTSGKWSGVEGLEANARRSSAALNLYEGSIDTICRGT
jgi:hypothetical protein